MNKRLAKISKANLEIQAGAILNFWIHVDYEEGCSQAVGGIALDEYCKEKGERIGTAYGCEMIRQLLIELRVNDSAEMTGRHIWVIGGGEGLSFKPRGIQSLRGDNPKSKPVIFSEVFGGSRFTHGIKGARQ